MVELRKRPAPKETAEPASKRSASKPRATTKAKQVIGKAKALVTGESSTAPTTTAPDSETTGASGAIPETVGAGTAGTEATTTTTGAESVPATTDTATETKAVGAPATAAPAATISAGEEATVPLTAESVGKHLPAAALSTPTTTHTGTKSTLSALLSASQSGIVIFTYPKASTPGCTTQACLFRDNFSGITGKGYDVYGLSNDSEKANTTFKTKQNLQYDMLCDPEAALTGVLGMKKPGNAKGTVRGVVIVGKDGKVEVWFQGGPPKTLEAVKEKIAF